MEQQSKQLERCVMCHHGLWSGDTCKICFPPADVPYVPQRDKVEEVTTLDLDDAYDLTHIWKEHHERKKRPKVDVEQKKPKKHVPFKREKVFLYTCVTCGEKTPSTARVCSPVCRVMAQKGFYTNKGVVSTITREQALILVEIQREKERLKNIKRKQKNAKR